MSPLTGERFRPFYKYINDTESFLDGDFRINILEHLKRELDGIIIPSGALAKNLLWLEIGLVVPGKDRQKTMVWICVPNLTSIEKNYETAIKKVKELKFSYNELTLNMCCERAEAFWTDENLNNLIISSCITQDFKDMIPCRARCVKKCGSGSHRCSKKKKSKIVPLLNMALACKCSDMHQWINLACEVDSNACSHTYFPIMRPGGVFSSPHPTENVVGGAVLFWKTPPPIDEILYFRRTIINTIWVELGQDIDFLSLDGIMSRQIPVLVRFSTELPFHIEKEHNDPNNTWRNKICSILCTEDKRDSCSIKYCGNHEQEDSICDYYKGMFQLLDDSIGRERAKYKFSEDSLLKKLCDFLELTMEINNCDEKIQLPYSPSWVFLATIKLLDEVLSLDDRTKNKKITLGRSDGLWHLIISFSGSEEDAKKLNTAVRQRLENKGDGNTRRAVVNVLYGSLAGRRKLLDRQFPNEKTVQRLISGLLRETETKYLDYCIDYFDKTIKIVFFWEHRSE